VGGWVASVIVNTPSLNDRIDVLKHFINVSVCCVHLNNYSSLMAILTGLSDPVVRRLKHTWNGLPKQELTIYDELNDMMSPKKYLRVERYCQQLQVPCIPYLGVYLDNLVSQECCEFSCFPLIKFSKYAAVGKLIAEIQKFQQLPYNLKPFPNIAHYFSGLWWVEENLHCMSRILEPRRIQAFYRDKRH